MSPARRLPALLLLCFCCCRADFPTPPAVDAGPPDLAEIRPIRIAAGRFRIAGITDDGFVILVNPDYNIGGVYAVSVDGGPTYTVHPTGIWAVVIGTRVFSWSYDDNFTRTVTLMLWSASGGSRLLSTNPATWVSWTGPALAAVSAGGEYIAYTGNLSRDDFGLDLMIARGDGSDARTVITNGLFEGDASMEFAPGTNRLLVAHDQLVNGVESPLMISSIDPSTGQVVDLLHDAWPAYGVTDDGMTALVIGADKRGYTVPIGGGALSPIDSMNNGQIHDGLVFYAGNGALKRARLANPIPTTLVASGADWVFGHSPDWRWIVYATYSNPRALGLASTEAPAPPRSVPIDGWLHDVAFTGDGSRFFYVEYWGQEFVTGRLLSAPVAGGAPTQHAETMTLAYATRGTRIVYNDHCAPASHLSPDDCDLLIADTATNGAPTLIAPRADPSFYLTAAKNRIVYRSFSGPDGQGIYVVPIPN